MRKLYWDVVTVLYVLALAALITPFILFVEVGDAILSKGHVDHAG